MKIGVKIPPLHIKGMDCETVTNDKVLKMLVDNNTTIFRESELHEKSQPKHTNENIFPCDFCNKKFSKPWKMRRHAKIHKNKSLKADDMLHIQCSHFC